MSALGKQTPTLTDITEPGVVQITIDAKGKTLWVNVDGICRLRACRCGEIAVLDDRRLVRGRPPYNSLEEARQDGWIQWDSAFPTNHEYYCRDGDTLRQDELLHRR